MRTTRPPLVARAGAARRDLPLAHRLPLIDAGGQPSM